MHKSGQKVNVTLIDSFDYQTPSEDNITMDFQGFLEDILIVGELTTNFSHFQYVSFLLNTDYPYYQTRILNQTDQDNLMPLNDLDDLGSVVFLPQRPFIMAFDNGVAGNFMYYRRVHKKVNPVGLSISAAALPVEPSTTVTAGAIAFNVETTIDIACKKRRH